MSVECIDTLIKFLTGDNSEVIDTNDIGSKRFM